MGEQELDTKTLSRLEKAVAKSEFSQGKKLKIVAKVGQSMVVSNGRLETDIFRSTPTWLVASSSRSVTAPST